MQSFDFLASLEKQLKPYRDAFPTMAGLPKEGRDRQELLKEIAAMQQAEEERWRQGYASGAVYHGNSEHIDFLSQVYALHSQSNPLHPDLFPSAVKFEAEIVAMTANMLGANQAADRSANPGGTDHGADRDGNTADTDQGTGRGTSAGGVSGTGGSGSTNPVPFEKRVYGTVSSGGTESLLLAVKTYRDWARAKKGIQEPEMIVPVTAHAAFEKAAQYFDIRLVRVPVDETYRADLAAVRDAITENTAVIVGSAPSFPHGTIDPIPELAALAQEHGIGCHVDACLGGFILPWADRLGYLVPPFDFRLPGVTSMSADTHKYGYAAKGTSVILYRGLDLVHHQYFATADWPGGLYFSPTFAGSRPGALSAACWAAMVSMGESGYLNATRRILETGAAIRAGIEAIPELHVLGYPLWVIAFGSEEVDVYQVMDAMTQRGWSLIGLQRPPAVHIALTLRHTQPGVAERFLADLRAAVGHVKSHPGEVEGMAPIYGMAAMMPAETVNEVLKMYVDMLFRL